MEVPHEVRSQPSEKNAVQQDARDFLSDTVCDCDCLCAVHTAAVPKDLVLNCEILHG